MTGADPTDLITIAPRVGLCANVHVRVLHPLLQRWHVLPVLPMLIPKVLGIE